MFKRQGRRQKKVPHYIGVFKERTSRHVIIDDQKFHTKDIRAIAVERGDREENQ
jgi:hypothetical protein